MRNYIDIFVENLKRFKHPDEKIASLSRRTELNQATLGKLFEGEGNPTLSTVTTLAQAVNREPWELLFDSESGSHPSEEIKKRDDQLKDQQDITRRVLEDNWKLREKIGDLTDDFFSTYQRAVPERRPVALKLALSILDLDAEPIIPLPLLEAFERATPEQRNQMTEAALQSLAPADPHETLQRAKEFVARKSSKGDSKR